MDVLTGLFTGLVGLILGLLPILLAIWLISTVLDIQKRVKNIEEKLDKKGE